jgi:hypothetical protein
MKRQPASKLTIEKGIPIPVAQSRRGYAEQLRKMKVGDSVLFTTGSAGAIRKRGLNAFGTGSYAVRAVEGGHRLWRLK